MTNRPFAKPSSGSIHETFVPLPLVAVMVHQQSKTNRHGVVSLAQGVNKHQVAPALGHLVAVHPDHRDMHPVAHELHTCGRLGLRSFTFMMRIDEVTTPAVQVDGGAEFAQGQGAAFDVPARSPRPPHRVPRWFVGGRGLPQHKIQRVALVRVINIAPALAGQFQHLDPIVMRERTELVRAGHVEIHRAAGFVGVAAFPHHADESTDLGNR